MLMRNYNVYIATSTGVHSAFITVNFDLLDAYKRALLNKEGFIIWDKGILDLSTVSGIIDNTYYEEGTK